MRDKTENQTELYFCKVSVKSADEPKIPAAETGTAAGINICILYDRQVSGAKDGVSSFAQCSFDPARFGASVSTHVR